MNVSVVMPMYRSERYVAEAIGSVLAQTAPPLEVIAVDDGSPDRSAEIARTLGVRVVSRPNGGIGAARNSGIEAARGDVIAFLDADDVFVPRALESQLALLAAGDHDAVVGHVEQFVSPDLDAGEAAAIRCPSGTRPGGCAGAMLIRREALDRVGGFAEGPVGEFVEWYARAIDAGVRFGPNPELVLRRRLHRTNTMRQRRSQHGEYARILKQALDRRRGAAG